jgi:hypothetical protein
VNCEEFTKLLNQYTTEDEPKEFIRDETMRLFRKHFQECDKCSEAFESQMLMLNTFEMMSKDDIGPEPDRFEELIEYAEATEPDKSILKEIKLDHDIHKKASGYAEQMVDYIEAEEPARYLLEASTIRPEVFAEVGQYFDGYPWGMNIVEILVDKKGVTKAKDNWKKAGISEDSEHNKLIERLIYLIDLTINNADIRKACGIKDFEPWL